MSGVHRFLSRRDRKNPRHASPSRVDHASKLAEPDPTQTPDYFRGTFAIEDEPKTKPEKEEERKIQGILERLRSYGITTMAEANARYALRVTSNQGDGEAAFRLLMLLQETYEGIVRPYNPEIKMLGAVNRESTTCYLDALLFAMFARLDSFEAMLYDSFDDIPRKRLAGLLRLWVNLLRTGRLITTDVTRQLQEALAGCGWDEASRLRQQDPSEAFTFITGQLGLPLLTLKMDLHHAGKEDLQDDHKFINERLLEVALVEESVEGRQAITLEDCLEHYFNNRIEVKRHLENQRRSTFKLATLNPVSNPTKIEKESGIHVEVSEVASASNTPLVQTPIAEPPTYTKDPLERVRPSIGRKRGDSIFSSRRLEPIGVEHETITEGPESPVKERERKMSTRTEVLMPAWQFFKLLPWYTDNEPTSDAQVAAHFSKKRPVLGICLKRYSYTNTGQAQKINTYIDIPTEIAVPNFVSDDNMEDEGPLVGNFRLLLQSVVCHRGVSVHSGHYVTLCRGTATDAARSRRGSERSDDTEDPWMRFDDLAKERVKFMDIHEAMKQETPYLLFYQVQPIGDDGHSIHDLPTYAEATSRSHSVITNLTDKPTLHELDSSDNAPESVANQRLAIIDRTGSDSLDWAPSPSARTSSEATRALEGPRGRSSFQGEERRRSITFDAMSYAESTSGGSIRTDATASVPSTPLEEKEPDTKTASNHLSVTNAAVSSRGGSRSKHGSQSKSRPTSAGPDLNASRFTLNMSKIAQKISRTEEKPISKPPNEPPPTTIAVTETTNDVSLSRPLAGDDQISSLQPTDTTHSSVNSDTTRASAAKPPARSTMIQGQPAQQILKKDKAASKLEKRRSKKGEEDRECTVM